VTAPIQDGERTAAGGSDNYRRIRHPAALGEHVDTGADWSTLLPVPVCPERGVRRLFDLERASWNLRVFNASIRL